VKAHTLVRIEGPQVADTGPEAVGSLGHHPYDLSFHLGHEFERFFFFIPETYTGVLLRRALEGTTLSTWAIVGVVPMGATLSSLDPSAVAPKDLRRDTVFFEAAGTDTSSHLAFSGAVG
jgi:hypothetical protein